ncbi:SpoVK/Ycf46/Vps4 family AAA+-type ATPase [Sinomonas atrocyanea]|uniref:AAA family ATPase n=1 Tax=Sinomonas atrocyanea TaxID=37927 RepID=UPI0027822E14|nr:AAA family ATPase [Sinomonas atrocyanea]MDP9883102.1 SpoVK/Ycf46/Vps4 family AAA+-type ATPase [Sinomonas atrocyanea]
MAAGVASARLGFEETLIDLIKARNPVLLVETHEAERVLKLVRSVAQNSEIRRSRRVATYTLTNGLQDGVAPGRPMAPDAALSEAAKVTEPTIFVFFDLHHYLGAGGRPAEPGVIRSVLDAAREFRAGRVPHTLLIVAPALPLPADLEKEVSVVELPLPGKAEIEAVLDEIITTNAANIVVDLSAEDRERLLQAAQGLTLGEAENAFARAIASDRRLDADDIDLVLDEKRQTIKKSGLLEFIEPAGSMEDIGGLENLKSWLGKRKDSWLPAASEWSIPAPKGVLITGVPGCGKSLTAKCMSTLWGLPLLRMDVGRVFSGLVGSSEQNMRAVLKLAEAVAPSILWIDEIEKGFGSSSSGDSGTSQRVFGTFLTWMQEKSKPVFVIATANKIDGLPPEFLRKGRFDEIFFVDLPTPKELKEIWRLQLSQRLTDSSRASGGLVLSDGLLQRLAEESNGFSGAEVAEAVVSACFDAYSQRRAVQEADLFRSIRNTTPLSKTQEEQIRQIREWASARAVAATSREDSGELALVGASAGRDVTSYRSGRQIEY